MNISLKSAVSTVVLFLILAICGVNGSFAETVRIIELLKPAITEAGAANLAMKEPGEVFINRTGQVVFAVEELLADPESSQADNAMVNAAFSETQLVLSFFPEQEVRITVDSESRPGRNILSLGGHQGENSISTFSMTVTEESYLITYQDLDSGMVYKVVGDMVTGVGRVTEIDLKKLPPVYDSEPILPPQK